MPTKDTIPLWLAAAITVVVSLPFGLWLGDWNLPLWIAFIVWAEYFALGAKPKVLTTIIPAFVLGVAGATVVLVFTALVSRALPDARLVTDGDAAVFLGFFLAFLPVVYAMRFLPVTQGPGELPFFNGISMGLAAHFTGQYGTVLGELDPVLAPLASSLAAVLAGVLGAVLGWFNATILFPRPVGK